MAIKKADLIKLRDAFVRSKGYTLADKEDKKPDQEKVDKIDQRMQRGGYQFEAGAGSQLGALDQARSMASSMSASVAGGEVGASTAMGVAAAQL